MLLARTGLLAAVQPRATCPDCRLIPPQSSFGMRVGRLLAVPARDEHHLSGDVKGGAKPDQLGVVKVGQ